MNNQKCVGFSDCPCLSHRKERTLAICAENGRHLDNLRHSKEECPHG